MPSTPIRPIIYSYLRDHGTAYMGELHKVYKDLMNPPGTLPKARRHVSTYHSFVVYLRRVIHEGYLERCNGTSLPPSDSPSTHFGEVDEYSNPVHLRLTSKGMNPSWTYGKAPWR